MKTVRVILPLLILIAISSISFSQPRESSPYNGGLRLAISRGRTVQQDSAGRIYTLFDFGAKNQQIMMGTPYWRYPTWQEGSVQLKANKPEVPCQIAYNVTANEVLCRFSNDTTTYTLEPAAFTISDTKFVRMPNHGYPTYYQVVYKGSAQLLSSYKRKMNILSPQPYGDAFFIGYFLGMERYYYVKLPNGSLHSVALTRKSLMRAMGDNVDTKLLPNENALTVNDVIRVLADYDAH